MSNLKKNVEQIRRARGLTEEELSARMGMTPDRLSEFLAAPPARKEKVVKQLSRELIVPEIMLFANEVPVRNTGIPDFRLAQPAPGGYARETLRWIDFAESVQAQAKLFSRPNPAKRLAAVIDPDLPIPRAAKRLREILEFSENEQRSHENARTMFAALRQKVETLNVFVLQLSFPDTDGAGFCIAGSPYDVVVLNTRKQPPARRSFTLFHEVYHCVLGKTGVSDPFVANNRIEQRCNAFAAEFLAPATLVRTIANDIVTSRTFKIDQLAKVAGQLNISLYATLIRLVELGIYGDNAVGAWKHFLSRNGDPEVKRGGGRRQEEWKYKLSRYGFKFGTVFGAAKAGDEFDDLEFFKFSGIRPKFQPDYIRHASRGRAEDADVDDDSDDGDA